jgi:hypothetical protein
MVEQQEFPVKLIVADSDKQEITIRIKLDDGTKHEIELNTTTKVGELYGHVKFISKMNDFGLSHGFDPVVTLTDMHQTMEEADLYNRAWLEQDLGAEAKIRKMTKASREVQDYVKDIGKEMGVDPVY